MNFEIKYSKIKHGYVRIWENWILKLSIPTKLKDNKDFENKLLEKWKILLEKQKKHKFIETKWENFLILFWEKIINPWFFKLNKNDQTKILKNLLYEKSIPILDKYSKLLDKKYDCLVIKDLKSKRWSCSRNQKIVLNLKLLHLPKHFLEYVIIHEVCHLKEKNHSKNFWKLVEYFLPNYKKIRKELRIYKI